MYKKCVFTGQSLHNCQYSIVELIEKYFSYSNFQPPGWHCTTSTIFNENYVSFWVATKYLLTFKLCNQIELECKTKYENSADINIENGATVNINCEFCGC